MSMSRGTRLRRSRAVSLTLVPLLATAASAAMCSDTHAALDPCEPATYSQQVCEQAVAQHGYWYSGMWYPRVYPYAPLFYYNRYSGFISSGGRVQSIAPTVYVPGGSTPAARPGVVRGGFGGIGAGHEAAGS